MSDPLADFFVRDEVINLAQEVVDRRFGYADTDKTLAWALLKLFEVYDEAVAANAILENICEHMATDHIVFQVLGNDEKVHPDWCVQCVLDRLRNAIAGRQRMIHEYLHGTDQYGIPDWRDCTQAICISAKQLAATKMPFAEDEKCTEPYTDKLRDALIERTVWDHVEGHDSNTDWRACPMPTCTEIKELVDAAAD